MEELYNPQKLYDYLRIHHWKDGIPEEFAVQWVSMKKTGHRLTDAEYSDFQSLFEKLNVNIDILIPHEAEPTEEIIEEPNSIPNIKDFPKFKNWMLKMISEIEKKV